MFLYDGVGGLILCAVITTAILLDLVLDYIEKFNKK